MFTQLAIVTGHEYSWSEKMKENSKSEKPWRKMTDLQELDVGNYFKHIDDYWR